MLRSKSTVQSQRIGVIGIGSAGLQHARAVVSCGHRVDAVGVESTVSRNIKNIKDIAPEVRIKVGYKELIKDDTLDALVVALPWHIIPKVLPELLASEKKMLIEKPLGLTAATIEAAIPKEKSRLVSKLIGFNRRFYKIVERVQSRLEKGGLKAVHIVISEDLERQKKAHGDEIVPHLMTFSSSHMLDLSLFLLGNLEVVKLYRRQDKSEFFSINGLLETGKGIPIHLSLNANDPSSAGFRFLFTDATTWALSPIEVLSVFDRYEIFQISNNSKIRRYVPHVCETFNEPVEYKPGFVAQMNAFLSGDFGPGASVYDALNTQRFIEKIKSKSITNMS